MIDFNKNHQTAIFRLPTKTDNANERMERFVKSLNRNGDGPSSTIKADVFTVDPDTKEIRFKGQVVSTEPPQVFAQRKGYTIYAVLCPA